MHHSENCWWYFPIISELNCVIHLLHMPVECFNLLEVVAPPVMLFDRPSYFYRRRQFRSFHGASEEVGCAIVLTYYLSVCLSLLFSCSLIVPEHIPIVKSRAHVGSGRHLPYLQHAIWVLPIYFPPTGTTAWTKTIPQINNVATVLYIASIWILLFQENQKETVLRKKETALLKISADRRNTKVTTRHLHIIYASFFEQSAN